MKPVLYIMSGLSFSGKTTLAKQLVEPLNAQLLSYDHDIWAVYKPTLPINISKTDEWKIVEAKAREHIVRLLKEGKNVIFDDLSVELRDRDLLRKTAKKCSAYALVIYMDVPAETVLQRQERNKITQERGLTSDTNMQLVMSQLQRPENSEAAVLVKENYDLNTVISRIKQKITESDRR